jgi:thiol-disulfide isomerase/thioredoxin
MFIPCRDAKAYVPAQLNWQYPSYSPIPHCKSNSLALETSDCKLSDIETIANHLFQRHTAMTRKMLVIFQIIFIGSVALPVRADLATLKPFIPGSYQQLLETNANKPFILVIWSITCSSCLKDMALLNKLHKANPKVNMVMLATDDASATDDIQKILAKNDLTVLENWIFADENPQKLRYEIDPKWYGELPRTYFLNKKHEREGISGVLSQEDYETFFKKALN